MPVPDSDEPEEKSPGCCSWWLCCCAGCFGGDDTYTLVGRMDVPPEKWQNNGPKLSIMVNTVNNDGTASKDTNGVPHATKYPVRRPRSPEPGRKVIAPNHLRELKAVDLRPDCPTVYNQGHLGSCTANSIGFAYEFNQMPDEPGETKFIPSRLFIYYNERAMEKTITDDAGAQIHDGIKSVMTTGVCPESIWPYGTTEEFTRNTEETEQGETIVKKGTPKDQWPLWAMKPTAECYHVAQYHRATVAHPVEQ